MNAKTESDTTERASERERYSDDRDGSNEVGSALERLGQLVAERSANDGERSSGRATGPTIDSSTEQFFESAARAVLRAMDDRAERQSERGFPAALLQIPPIHLGIWIGNGGLVTPTPPPGTVEPGGRGR